MKLSRRSLLGTGIAGAAGIASGAGAFASLQGMGSKQSKIKNIIFLVVDGMAMQTLGIVDILSQLNGGKSSYWGWLMDQKFVTNGLQATRSLNSVVTDSAAASSAWGSGQHIFNGMINMYPDQTALKTLTTLMHEKGVRTGLVTTTTITHATPSGFAISIVNRDLEPIIAEKHLTSGVDVLMGGGNRHFAGDKRKDKRDLYPEFEKAGYTVVKNREALMETKSKKVLGIFSDSHLPFSVDRNNSPELQKTVPTLAEMTKHAIDNLKDSKNGFLLQVEGGKVDHAGHANDLASLVYDQIAFEEAVKVAVEFALKDKETLVIITADHATGGPSLNGMGEEYADSNKGILTVNGMKASYEVLARKFGASPTADSVRDIVKADLGLELSAAEAAAIVAGQKGQGPFNISGFLKASGMTMANILGNHTAVTWTSGNHTAEHVMVTALGPGSEMIKGLTRNVEFFDLMLAAKGIKHKNPTMDYATAQGHYEKMKVSLDQEWLDMYAVHEDCTCHHG